MRNRRKAREMALQALYEIECANHSVESVLTERLNEKPLGKESETFMRNLVNGVLTHASHLDKQISAHAPEWPLDQMALVDRSILRIALWEFTIGQATPIKVAINEAVELAKEFGSESAPRFVNGVLGAVAAEKS